MIHQHVQNYSRLTNNNNGGGSGNINGSASGSGVESANEQYAGDANMALLKVLLQTIKANQVDKFENPNSELMAKLCNALRADRRLGVVLMLACCELNRYEILKILLSPAFAIAGNNVSFASHSTLPVSSNALINVNCTNDDGISGLMIAVKKDNCEIVELLLRISSLKLQAVDNYGWTALMYGCYYGSVKCVKLLLQANATVNTYDNDHISNLIWASGRGYNEIVRLLLESGAKVDAADKYGTTPLIWACRKGFTQVAETLLQAGANINATGMFGWSALLTTARGGYVETTRILLRRDDINVNTCDAQRLSPLMIASKEGSEEIVRMLIGKGAFVNLSDRYGHTALIRAVRGNHVSIVQALITANADLDHIGFDKKTAIFWAVEKGYKEVVKILLLAKPNLEVTTSDGETCLIRAVKSHRQDIVKLLLENNARVTVTDKFGDTVLHMAVRSQSKSIVELILLADQKNWSLIHKQNKQKETPFSIDQTNSSTPIFPKLFDEFEHQFGVKSTNSNNSLATNNDDAPLSRKSGNRSALNASFSSLSKFISQYQLSISSLSPTVDKKAASASANNRNEPIVASILSRVDSSTTTNRTTFDSNCQQASAIWLPPTMPVP